MSEKWTPQKIKLTEEAPPSKQNLKTPDDTTEANPPTTGKNAFYVIYFDDTPEPDAVSATECVVTAPMLSNFIKLDDECLDDKYLQLLDQPSTLPSPQPLNQTHTLKVESVTGTAPMKSILSSAEPNLAKTKTPATGELGSYMFHYHGNPESSTASVIERHDSAPMFPRRIDFDAEGWAKDYLDLLEQQLQEMPQKETPTPKAKSVRDATPDKSILGTSGDITETTDPNEDEVPSYVIYFDDVPESDSVSQAESCSSAPLLPYLTNFDGVGLDEDYLELLERPIRPLNLPPFDEDDTNLALGFRADNSIPWIERLPDVLDEHVDMPSVDADWNAIVQQQQLEWFPEDEWFEWEDEMEIDEPLFERQFFPRNPANLSERLRDMLGDWYTSLEYASGDHAGINMSGNGLGFN